ncbi:MAG: hypothetical protein CL666_10380 [Balneola sp.]|nr:hypothetical protein [Balneola sp.]|tara:strand:+ start:10855 stop:13101 length:2247 start_codon:yes stop_codon:yes gene_type:complete
MNRTEIYHKYLDNVTQTKDQGLQGDSPWGDGKITITKSGDFSCSATGKSGTVIDFIGSFNPTMTNAGLNKVLASELVWTKPHLESILKSVDSFKNDAPRLKVASEKLELPKSFLKQVPGFMSTREFQYSMIDHYSPSGVPLTVSNFSLDKPLARTIGVPRMPEEISETTFFVENSLVAKWITKQLKLTALPWPKEDDLQNYHYDQLLKDKKVIILYEDFSYTYSDSFLPSLEAIQDSVKSFSALKYRDITQGTSFVKWIKEPENQAKLFEKAQDCANKPLIPQDVYQKSIYSSTKEELTFAQGYSRGFFFYGMNDGNIVQSHPLDIHSVDSVEKKFDLSVVAPAEESRPRSVKLSPSTILNITESVSNVSPVTTYATLRNFISERIYFGENEQDLEMVTLWILGTYVYRLFNAYPYLHIQGPAGSGKTTLLEIIESTSFNGALASRITGARMMKEINDTKCTLGLDEFEKSSGSQSAANTQILNAGYKKSGRYLKMMGEGENDKYLDLYSPKAYASIGAIKTDSLTSRTLPIWQQKAPSSLALKPWDPADRTTEQQITSIVEGGYAIGLYHHHYLQYLMATLPNKILLPSGLSLEGRQRELALPILVLANFIDPSGSLEATIKDLLQAKLAATHQDTIRRIKMFTNTLREWSADLDDFPHATDEEMVWISNKVWGGTAILSEFNGKNNSLYNWIKTLHSDVAIKSVWIPKLDKSISSIGIPLDLNINNKEIRSWLKLNSSSEDDKPTT